MKIDFSCPKKKIFISLVRIFLKLVSSKKKKKKKSSRKNIHGIQAFHYTTRRDYLLCEADEMERRSSWFLGVNSFNLSLPLEPREGEKEEGRSGIWPIRPGSIANLLDFLEFSRTRNDDISQVHRDRSQTYRHDPVTRPTRSGNAPCNRCRWTVLGGRGRFQTTSRFAFWPSFKTRDRSLLVNSSVSFHADTSYELPASRLSVTILG